MLWGLIINNYLVQYYVCEGLSKICVYSEISFGYGGLVLLEMMSLHFVHNPPDFQDYDYFNSVKLWPHCAP